jgi:hypothetical protein
VSIHGIKSKRRHPDAPRECFQVGHVTFEISETNGTFALIAGDAIDAKNRRPLFTGFVTSGMATQLRKLAHRFDELECDL